MKPFFSTIIPTHNRAQLLSAALDSVLAQEFDDNEILVVDDGSTDATSEVLARYEGRVRVLRQQEQRGPGAARNLGIESANGKYVAFLDSDDLWFPWTLSTYHTVIEKQNEPAFLAGGAVRFRREIELTRIPIASTRVTCFADYYASSKEPLWIGTCAAAIRSDVLKNVGGFTQESINAEDSDLWMRLGVAPGFVRIDAPPVFAYRQHGGSAVSDFSRNYRGKRFLMEQESAGNYPGGAERQRERVEILSRHLRPTSLECLKRGQVACGWELFQGSLRWNARLGRIRYLLGFPLLCLLALARGRRSRHAAASELARAESLVESGGR